MTAAAPTASEAAGGADDGPGPGRVSDAWASVTSTSDWAGCCGVGAVPPIGCSSASSRLLLRVLPLCVCGLALCCCVLVWLPWPWWLAGARCGLCAVCGGLVGCRVLRRLRRLLFCCRFLRSVLLPPWVCSGSRCLLLPLVPGPAAALQRSSGPAVALLGLYVAASRARAPCCVLRCSVVLRWLVLLVVWRWCS